jgi:hypothetical protein
MNGTTAQSLIEQVTGSPASLGIAEALADIATRPVVRPPGGLLRAINCCACSREIEWKDWEFRETPATKLKYVYALHPNRQCRDAKTDSSAVVVCVNCRSMLLIRTDEKPAVDGFVLRKKKTYHILACAYCSPDLKQVTIVEQQIASRKHKAHNT